MILGLSENLELIISYHLSVPIFLGIYRASSETKEEEEKTCRRYEFDWKRDLILKANSLSPFVPGARSPHINGPLTRAFQ